MYKHLTSNGIMEEYTIWDQHGEASNIPSLWDQREVYLQNLASSSSSVDPSINSTMKILGDAFSFRESYNTTFVDGVNDVNTGVHVDPIAKAAMDKYNRLLTESHTPLYEGSNKTVLGSILKSMQIKLETRISNKCYDEWCRYIKNLLPPGNKYPESYAQVKKILKNIGMGYEVIHACYYGCFLFYKEGAKLQECPICKESRWIHYEDGKRIPRKTVLYFPLTPRLQRLYMSPYTAKKMRWHGERIVDPDYLRHPADGEAWQDFDRSHPEFASDFRNVRLGLATDGFSPFGATALSHSTWPIVVMPYNLPLSMCMKKEFNILVMLISGPKSPGKCLNVFMRPLIDELKVLWDTGVWTWDQHKNEPFWMKAAVMWTISDFSGLKMLGGIQTKGYKACPICLDDIDAAHSNSRMSYKSARRWLCEDHRMRTEANKFNGKAELRATLKTRYASEVFEATISHQYPVLSLHPGFKQIQGKKKPCWTHVSIFWELPYWKQSRLRHALDVMHIEKNVCDNVFRTVLGLERKTKNDAKARETLKKMGKKGSSGKASIPQADYTVDPEYRSDIFKWVGAAKYPRGYAGSLKNKVNAADKKFYGLKTHDCHILLQRLFPIFIRAYLVDYVVDPLVELSRFFQMLCARELKKSDVRQMQQDIVMILCKLERIFPPTFFTIMIHFMIHLPEQALLTGPVHFTWMFSIERQLGEYKKFVKNTRFPEGCIAEQYIMHECVTYINLYMGDPNAPQDAIIPDASRWNISIVSDHVMPNGYVANVGLSREELAVAHWCVMEHCDEAEPFIEGHQAELRRRAPYVTNEDDEHHIQNFHPHFHHWVDSRP